MRRIAVRNFRCLRDVEVELGKLNVLIGPNMSGKSSFIQALRLLRDLTEPGIVNPFAKFWGYNNVVWGHDESLSLYFRLEFSDGTQYEVEFTGTGGRVSVLREFVRGRAKVFWRRREAEAVVEREGFLVKVLAPDTLEVIKEEKLPGRQSLPLINKGVLAFPILLRYLRPLSEAHKDLTRAARRILRHISDFLSRILALQIIPLKAKMPVKPERIEALDYNGGNLHALLYTLFGPSAVSDRMLDVLQVIFSDIEAIRLKWTEDRRVHLEVEERGVRHPSDALSDGFYKVLAILAALELRPSMLVIDEIENSLHMEALQVIIDVLRRSDAQVILTTHSPAVLDLVEPEEVILVSKEAGETKMTRLEEPEKIRATLEELGMSLGQSWLYGGLP